MLFTDLGPSVGHVFESLWRVGSPATQNAWVRRSSGPRESERSTSQLTSRFDEMVDAARGAGLELDDDAIDTTGAYVWPMCGKRLAVIIAADPTAAPRPSYRCRSRSKRPASARRCPRAGAWSAAGDSSAGNALVGLVAAIVGGDPGSLRALTGGTDGNP